MTQRNNFDTAELPPRAGSLGLSSAGQDTLANDNSTSRLATRGRRASRIPISLPVMLRDQFGGQHQARTQSVMVRGAVVTSTANLRVGHKLTMQNLKSGKSAECHVTSIEPGIATSNTVELEFTGTQPDFWPVQFPSENSAPVAATPPLTSADQLSLADDISGPPKVRSEISSPPIRQRETELVSLADSVEHNFSAPAIAAKPVVPRTPPPTDSVALFRAANRAAHRRQQRMKTLYSAATVLALIVLAFAGKSWLSHRPATTDQPEAFAPQPAKRAKTVAAKPSASAATSPSAAVANVFAALKSTPSKVMERIKLPVAAKTTPAPAETVTAPADTPTAVDTTPVAQAQPVEDTQVTVKHGSSLASQRVQDNGEEPVALPLTASIPAASQPKPEVLNQVVAQTPPPPKPVGLAPQAPQVPKQLTPARLIASAPAQYPAMARQLHAEGEVVLNLDVDASGQVSDAKVLSGPPILRNAALDSVRRWKYQPATLGDQPVASTQTVKVDFRLK